MGKQSILIRSSKIFTTRTGLNIKHTGKTMQSLFSFITDKANAVSTYEAQGVERIGDKLWFSYQNKAGSNVSAYYDFKSRSFKSVVRGKQYGKSGYAVRNLVARPVIESALGEWVTYPFALGFNVRNYLVWLGWLLLEPSPVAGRWGLFNSLVIRYLGAGACPRPTTCWLSRTYVRKRSEDN